MTQRLRTCTALTYFMAVLLQECRVSCYVSPETYEMAGEFFLYCTCDVYETVEWNFGRSTLSAFRYNRKYKPFLLAVIFLLTSNCWMLAEHGFKRFIDYYVSTTGPYFTITFQ